MYPTSWSKAPDQVYVVDVQVVSDAGVRRKLEEVEENKGTKYDRAEYKTEALKMLGANTEITVSVLLREQSSLVIVVERSVNQKADFSPDFLQDEAA